MEPSGSFALVDHHGRSVTDETYRGRWMLMFFGFTHCRVICPRALGRLSGVLDALEESVVDRVQALYVTVDPERDTPDVMRAFLEDRYPRFTGLTGTPEQIESTKASFGVFARRKNDPEDPDGYAVPHTAITYLFDESGAYATHWTDATESGQIVSDLRRRTATRGTEATPLS
jgi:protein SCO1